MSTLIHSGRRVCNSQCYDAKSPAKKCKCICGGANHGVGRKEAIRRTLAWARAQKQQAESVIYHCTVARLEDAQETVFRSTMNAGISL